MRLTHYLLDHAVIALHEILPFTQPADAILSRYFRKHSKLGQQDREFIAENIFTVLRRKRLLSYLSKSEAARPLILASLIKLQGLSLRELSPFLNEQEKTWLVEIKSLSIDTLPFALQVDFPDWLIDKLKKEYSNDEILSLARGVNQSAPLDLRVNLFKAKRDDVLIQMRQDNFQVELCPLSPSGLRMKDKPRLTQYDLFKDGVIEVQDEGSQLLCYLVAPRRGEMIADFCAGAGGKSLALGALMRSTGRIYAFDTSQKRLEHLKPRLKRSGLSNLHAQLIQDENDKKLKRLAHKFDRVLVDAPCSGLGTLRRNPDLKWRQSPESVAELTLKQKSILSSAAKLLKPGGKLIYATCSFLAEENEDVIQAFLQSYSDMKLLDTNDILAKQQINLTPNRTDRKTNEYLRLYPHQHGTDGFFAAVLEKTKP